MRPSTPPRRIATRILATFLAWTFIFGQTVQVAYAATTALADVPIAAKVSAKPNIVYTLDDSGSMQYNFLPDYANNTAPAISLSNLTRSGTTATASGSAANIALVNVGDWVTVEATGGPAEFNGAFLVTAKPTATTFTYTMSAVPASNSSGTRRFWIGAMYCRSGNTTVACPQQAVNISTGSAINHQYHHARRRHRSGAGDRDRDGGELRAAQHRRLDPDPADPRPRPARRIRTTACSRSPRSAPRSSRTRSRRSRRTTADSAAGTKSSSSSVRRSPRRPCTPRSSIAWPTTRM